MWKFYLTIAAGGALGASGRFLFGRVIGTLSSGFPLSTLLVNCLGCFLIGFVSHYFAMRTVPIIWQAGFTIGFLGGLTTFSAYALELTLMLEKDQWIMAVSYLFLANFLCTLAVIAGMVLSRIMI